jgi:hypothetical protein
MSRRSILMSAVTGAFVFLAFGTPLPASPLTVIPQPVASYTSSTTLINITALSGNVGSIIGGGLTVDFSTSMAVLKTGVINGWGTWNSPPATETNKLTVLYTRGATDVLLTLSSPVSKFGFEAQPDLSDVEKITAKYYDASDVLLGTLALDVSGNAGALLFAVSAGMNEIASIDIADSGPGGTGCPACDFAIAQVRFSQTPEPVSFLLVGAGFMALRAVRFSRRS